MANERLSHRDESLGWLGLVRNHRSSPNPTRCWDELEIRLRCQNHIAIQGWVGGCGLATPLAWAQSSAANYMASVVIGRYLKGTAIAPRLLYGLCSVPGKGHNLPAARALSP